MSNKYKITYNLKKGWNLVGIPYTTTVDNDGNSIDRLTPFTSLKDEDGNSILDCVLHSGLNLREYLYILAKEDCTVSSISIARDDESVTLLADQLWRNKVYYISGFTGNKAANVNRVFVMSNKGSQNNHPVFYGGDGKYLVYGGNDYWFASRSKDESDKAGASSYMYWKGTRLETYSSPTWSCTPEQSSPNEFVIRDADINKTDNSVCHAPALASEQYGWYIIPDGTRLECTNPNAEFSVWEFTSSGTFSKVNPSNLTVGRVYIVTAASRLTFNIKNRICEEGATLPRNVKIIQDPLPVKPCLVTRWTDDINEIDEDEPNSFRKTALTAQGVKSFVDDVFSGVDLDADGDNIVNINNTTIGSRVYRIIKNANNTGTYPPIDDYTGFLVIHDISDTSSSEEPGSHIRQIIYPDDGDNQAPWTRVWNNGAWSEWSMMGGGLRRVLLTGDVTAQLNVMYESFGDYTLTLPAATAVAVGTKIGLEQYSGSGKVVCGEYEQITEPLVDANSGSETGTAIAYVFECCLSESGAREWVMDYDHCESRAIDSLAKRVSVLSTTTGRAVMYSKFSIDEPFSKLAFGSCADETDHANYNQPTNVYVYDQHVDVMANGNAVVVDIPYQAQNPNKIIDIVLHIYTNGSATSVTIEEMENGAKKDDYMFTIPIGQVYPVALHVIGIPVDDGGETYHTVWRVEHFVC